MGKTVFADPSGMARWRGRTALVTGASSGIGRAVSTMLARHGMKVALAARRRERLEAVRDEIERAGGSAFVLPVDVRVEDQIARMFDDLRAHGHGIDVLVNSAGLGHSAPLVSAAAEPWREMLEVNVLALCICTREAVRSMRARDVDGHIVHISSMSGHRVPSGSGVYAATKYAVRALTEALRQELRSLDSPIRVTAISPGFVETEFATVYHGGEAAARKTHESLEALQAEDIAAAVAYVLGQPAHVQVHDILLRPLQQKT